MESLEENIINYRGKKFLVIDTEMLLDFDTKKVEKLESELLEYLMNPKKYNLSGTLLITSLPMSGIDYKIRNLGTLIRKNCYQITFFSNKLNCPIYRNLDKGYDKWICKIDDERTYCDIGSCWWLI